MVVIIFDAGQLWVLIHNWVPYQVQCFQTFQFLELFV